MAIELNDRFWAKVDKGGSTPEYDPALGGCWVWVAAKREGYGAFKVKGRVHGAHRLSYEAHHGPIQAGLDVDHRCWRRECVNPSHLQAVTRSANMQNRTGANSNSTTGARGVSYKKSTGVYRASGRRDGASVHIGHFDSLESASTAASLWRATSLNNSLVDYAALRVA